nr:immunoglobulin light chain junction region [Macaca mulatta]MOV66843.1 immunoglobulin light chain junction region [Macaca mulatta]MOV67050.1 immunoglobulin light chain junction region [Macaca mulatta]MOV67474.1 immunoglobulin light chain junction region [Macaca mulatta]MOV67675.1 immunoglobulin light chain junction region [Macaca mulatta]
DYYCCSHAGSDIFVLF